MTQEERYAGCRNCGRMQPQSLLNKEGRCRTCGDSQTTPAAADPSEVGPHGAQESEATEEQPPAGDGFPPASGTGDQPPPEQTQPPA